MIFSCRRAAELTSREIDTPLSAGERFSLVAHRLICSSCRRFRGQIEEIDGAFAGFVDAEPAGTETMSEESMDRIRQAMKREVAKGERDTPHG